MPYLRAQECKRGKRFLFRAESGARELTFTIKEGLSAHYGMLVSVPLDGALRRLVTNCDQMLRFRSSLPQCYGI